MRIARSFIMLMTLILVFANTIVMAESKESGLVKDFGIEITTGVEHKLTSFGFTTYIDRESLPDSMKGFKLISVQSWYTPPGLDDTFNVGAIALYSDKGYNSSVPKSGDWYPLTVIFDAEGTPLAFHRGHVNTAASSNPNVSNPVEPSKPNSSDPNKYGSDIDPNHNKPSEAALFSDVNSSHWAYAAIKDLNTRKVLGGYPDGKFRPERVVTRAEFAKIMVLAAGLTPKDVTATSFSDIKPDDWYTPYIEAAKDYLSGYTLPNGQLIYDPEAPALREDIAVAVVKLKGYDKTRYVDLSIIQAMFTDYNSISNYAKNYVALAVENKLVSGFPDETFRAQSPITRAEAAAMLWRAYQQGNDNKVQQETPKVPSGLEKGPATQTPVIVPTVPAPSVTDSVYGTITP